MISSAPWANSLIQFKLLIILRPAGVTTKRNQLKSNKVLANIFQVFPRQSKQTAQAAAATSNFRRFDPSVRLNRQDDSRITVKADTHKLFCPVSNLKSTARIGMCQILGNWTMWTVQCFVIVRSNPIIRIVFKNIDLRRECRSMVTVCLY